MVCINMTLSAIYNFKLLSISLHIPINAVVAIETAHNEVMLEIQKLQKMLSESQTRWENEKAKLSTMLSEKDQCITVSVYLNCSIVIITRIFKN